MLYHQSITTLTKSLLCFYFTLLIIKLFVEKVNMSMTHWNKAWLSIDEWFINWYCMANTIYNYIKASSFPGQDDNKRYHRCKELFLGKYVVFSTGNKHCRLLFGIRSIIIIVGYLILLFISVCSRCPLSRRSFLDDGIMYMSRPFP